MSGTLALLYTVFGLKFGCDRAAALTGDEVLYNGEIFRLSVRLLVRPSAAPLEGATASEAGLRARQAGPRASET